MMMKKAQHIILILLILVAGFSFLRPSSAIATPPVVIDSVYTATLSDNQRALMRQAVDNFVASKAMHNASVSVCVIDIASGEVVAAHNADSNLTPASVTKTITSAAALKHFSPDYVFRTRVECIGERTDDGVLDGDIVVVGGIDPTLGSKYFPDQPPFIDLVVDNLKAEGIKKINGVVRARETIAVYQAVPEKWDDDDVAEDYGAGIHSINYCDNLFSLIIDTSTGKAEVVDTIPHIKGLTIQNKMSVGRSGRFSPAMHRKKNTNNLVLTGTLRRTEDPIEAITTMPHPAEGLCADLREALEADGIEVCGKKIDLEEDTLRLLSYASPKLSEILASLLHRSDNMYAESVQRRLGESLYGKPTLENGEKAVMNIVHQWGVETKNMKVYDGSGLSRTNRYSSHFLAEVLRGAAIDPITKDVFPSLLPVCGKDGTVRRLCKETSLSGLIALKSGSMRGVRCYAGYFPVEKPQFAVVMLANNFRCGTDTLISAIEDLLVGMFQQYLDNDNDNN